MAEFALIANLVAFLLFAFSPSGGQRRGRSVAGADSVVGENSVGGANSVSGVNSVSGANSVSGGREIVGGHASAFYRGAIIATVLAAVALGGLVVYRSIRISFPALTGTYEGLVVFALSLDLFLSIGHQRVFRRDSRILAGGAFATFLILAIMSSPIVSSALYPPIPVLRSYWLVIHVAFSFVGLALFTTGAVAAILGSFSSDPASIDRSRDYAVALGFVFYTTGGLIFGAIWAEAAWGRFWGWDPKETWALITTLFYTGYLHLRYVRRVTQRTARVLVIVAWFLAGFTFWGVNMFMSGLHSYG